MQQELLKCLIDYYSKLANTEDKWRVLAKSVERTIEALKNQTEQFQHVTSSEVDNAELCKVEGLRERLIFKIHAGIEDEVERICEALIHFKNYNQELKTKLKKLESVRDKVSLEDEVMKELMDGTPRRPALNLLLEWAIDSHDYYEKLYCTLRDSLKAVDYKDEASVERLADSFVESESMRMKIDRILAYTQFIARQPIR
ncbi:uncharacterized protein LOC106647815 [Copidosoma floridanum]|uniref:uncharacterized protein LOC106647815 n=1 Tax=Copidosoma floridanum TaxID=29053 RepID=UPI0006C94018|nr:uncharacterized protein LOC106647815 [Copidosoma floridanum]